MYIELLNICNKESVRARTTHIVYGHTITSTLEFVSYTDMTHWLYIYHNAYVRLGTTHTIYIDKHNSTINHLLCLSLQIWHINNYHSILGLPVKELPIPILAWSLECFNELFLPWLNVEPHGLFFFSFVWTVVMLSF